MITVPGILMLFSLAASLHAGEIEALAVEHEGDIYRVIMIFEVAAPVARVRAVLTDYTRLSALNTAIVESGVLPAPTENATRVRTRTQDCILFLCADIIRVEDVTGDSDGGFRSTIVPGVSDMKSGFARWQFQSRRQATRITFKARMEPDFWIPPIIGPMLIKGRLQAQLEETADNLERLAAARH